MTLTAEDFAGPNRWYWRLKDGDRLLADHEVQIDPGELFESLPKQRAATGPEALAQVLAMANEEPDAHLD